MKLKLLSIIGILSLSTVCQTLSASEVGARHNTYENGSGMEYYGSIDISYGARLNASMSSLNMEEVNLLSLSEGNNLEMNFVRYGIGYFYNIGENTELYINANKASLEVSDITIELANQDDPVVVPIEDIEGYEYDLGIKYRFLENFEIDISGKIIDYKTYEKAEAFSGKLSYYITDGFKINASYAENSFLAESVYSVGLSYKF